LEIAVRNRLQSADAIRGLQSRLDRQKQSRQLANTWQIDGHFVRFRARLFATSHNANPNEFPYEE
jgi:hypothetical protein